MLSVPWLALGSLLRIFRNRQDLIFENFVLRQQLTGSYPHKWGLRLSFGNIDQSKSCRVSLLWRKRQQVNSPVSFAYSHTLDFHLYLLFQQLAAMSS
jgi:hypothetical protein